MSVANIGKLQENTTTLCKIGCDTLRVSTIRGSRYVYLEKLKCPPLPSGVWSGCETSGDGGTSPGQNSGCGISGEDGTSQGWSSACAWCRDPSRATPSGFPQEDMRRHVILSNSIRIPSGGHAPPCYPDSLREKHTALVNIIPGR